DRSDVRVAARVVVLALPILGTRLAVPDATSTVAEPPDELAHLRGEGLRAPVAGSVQPPDLAGRRARREGVQHRQHRRRADSRAQEHHRAPARLQHEATARLADVEDVSGSDVAGQERAPGPVRLELDAHAVPLLGQGTGERVAAEQERPVGARAQPQHHELSRQRRGQPPSLGRLQGERDDVDALAIDPRDAQGPEPGSRRVRSHLWHETGVARRAGVGRLGAKQRLERPPPARRERRDAERPLELLARMVRGIEQRIDLGDGHALQPSSDRDDLVARADLPLLEDPEVEPGASAAGEERSHPRLVEANPDPVAGRPWLGDLEHGRSDPEPVADADLVVGEPVDGEVLAELAVRQLGPPELPFPVAIRLDLIDEDRALLSPVAAEVALAITHEVEAIDPPTALDRVLPDSGVHGPPAPLDVAWKSDVDR